MPFRSVTLVLSDFFCWKCNRRLSKLSSLSLSGCSNDTLGPFSDGFDIFVAPFFKFDIFGFSNVVFLVIVLLVVKLILFTVLTLSGSSFSSIGLNTARVCFCGSLDDAVFPPDSNVLSLALSITTVSKLVDVDEFDNDPSAVSTRE